MFSVCIYKRYHNKSSRHILVQTRLGVLFNERHNLNDVSFLLPVSLYCLASLCVRLAQRIGMGVMKNRWLSWDKLGPRLNPPCVRQ